MSCCERATTNKYMTFSNSMYLRYFISSRSTTLYCVMHVQRAGRPCKRGCSRTLIGPKVL